MKIHLRGILCVLVALCGVFCLTACVKVDNDSSSDNPQEIEEANTFVPTPEMVGTYTLCSMGDSISAYEGKDLELFVSEIGFKEMSEFMSLEVKEDGTGELSTMGNPLEIVLGETTFWAKDNEVEAFAYTFAENKFSYTTYDGTTYVFIHD